MSKSNLPMIQTWPKRCASAMLMRGRGLAKWRWLRQSKNDDPGPPTQKLFLSRDFVDSRQLPWARKQPPQGKFMDACDGHVHKYIEEYEELKGAGLRKGMGLPGMGWRHVRWHASSDSAAGKVRHVGDEGDHALALIVTQSGCHGNRRWLGATESFHVALGRAFCFLWTDVIRSVFAKRE